MKKAVKNKKVNVPQRIWDTEWGGILGSACVGITFVGVLLLSLVSAYELGTMPAWFYATLTLGTVGLFATEAIVILPEGQTYMGSDKKVKRDFDFSPFKREYTLISSVKLTVPMFWGKIDLEMDCSQATKIPTVDEIQFGVCLVGSAETPEANVEAETALLLARRGVILRKFTATKDEDYDPKRYYDGALKAYERSCA